MQPGDPLLVAGTLPLRQYAPSDITSCPTSVELRISNYSIVQVQSDSLGSLTRLEDSITGMETPVLLPLEAHAATRTANSDASMVAAISKQDVIAIELPDTGHHCQRVVVALKHADNHIGAWSKHAVAAADVRSLSAGSCNGGLHQLDISKLAVDLPEMFTAWVVSPSCLSDRFTNEAVGILLRVALSGSTHDVYLWPEELWSGGKTGSKCSDSSDVSFINANGRSVAGESSGISLGWCVGLDGLRLPYPDSFAVTGAGELLSICPLYYNGTTGDCTPATDSMEALDDPQSDSAPRLLGILESRASESYIDLRLHGVVAGSFDTV